MTGRLSGPIALWLGEGSGAWLARALYLFGRRRPWSIGYSAHRAHLLERAVRDEELLALFRRGQPLPGRYGVGLDERVVEYPWVLGRLGAEHRTVLDAGATLTMPEVVGQVALEGRAVLAYSLSHQWRAELCGVAAVVGDLRRLGLRPGSFDAAICISTLEHVGLDNTGYVGSARYREDSHDAYRIAVRELARVLAPGGSLLLTVPYGRAMSLGWMQQFDASALAAVAEAFGAAAVEESYFRYSPEGWQRSDAEACRDCVYFDVRAGTGRGRDGAAAARAVACVELRRSSGSGRTPSRDRHGSPR